MKHPWYVSTKGQVAPYAMSVLCYVTEVAQASVDIA